LVVFAMTLDQMRDVVRDNIFDNSGSGDFWTDARLTLKVNHAMQYVGNLVASQRKAHFLAEFAGSISNGSGARWVLQSLSGENYTQVRELVYGERTTGYDGDDREMKIIKFTDLDKYIRGSLQDKPQLFLYGSQFGYVRPADAAAVKVVYVAGLPDMSADNDKPGQAGGVGTADLLPIEYQPLITAHATIECLSAMGLNPQGWQGIFGQLAAGLGLVLKERTRPPAAG